MTVRATSAGGPGVLMIAAVCAAFLLAGCGTNGSGSTGGGAATPARGASGVATPASGADGSGDKIAATTVATLAPAADRAEIERRLALPRFTYVGETDYRGAQGVKRRSGLHRLRDRHAGLSAAHRRAISGASPWPRTAG